MMSSVSIFEVIILLYIIREFDSSFFIDVNDTVEKTLA